MESTLAGCSVRQDEGKTNCCTLVGLSLHKLTGNVSVYEYPVLPDSGLNTVIFAVKEPYNHK